MLTFVSMKQLDIFEENLAQIAMTVARKPGVTFSGPSVATKTAVLRQITICS